MWWIYYCIFIYLYNFYISPIVYFPNVYINMVDLLLYIYLFVQYLYIPPIVNEKNILRKIPFILMISWI